MLTQKKTFKVLMFLLPAVVSLLAYTAYHEMLFQKPPCLINCEKPGLFSDNEKFKKWLAFLESLRKDNFSASSSSIRSFPTPLDIAFLQDKINLASNDNDYLTRYQQIISDLTSPSVVKDTASSAIDSSLPENVSQLAYLTEDKDPNNQVFANSLDENETAVPFTEPRTGPYYAPATGNGPAFFAGGGNPNINGGSSGGDGGNSAGANNGLPGGGTPGPGGGTPTGPGGGTPIIGGGGNPISTVPVPGSGYLIAGVLIAISLLRLQLSKRNKSFEH